MIFEDPFQFMLLVFSGGLALFLIGLRFLSEASQLIGEKKIYHAIGEMHSNFSSVISGVITSFFVQSRLSTSLMASSYATSGIFSLSQLICFLLGANIGSVLVLWLFVINWKALSLVFVVIGVFLKMYSTKESLISLGKLFFALGMLVLGQWLVQLLIPMSTILTFTLRAPENLIDLWPIYGIFVALTIVVRSSVAMVALTMVMAMLGVVGVKLALILIIFIQIGATIPAVSESWKIGRKARFGQSYSLFAHLIMGGISLLFFEQLYPFIQILITKIPSEVSGTFSMLHPNLIIFPLFVFTYNLIMVVIFSFGVAPFKKYIFVKYNSTRPKELQKLKLVGQSLQVSPVMGIDLATQETMKMAAMIESLLIMTREVIYGNAEKSVPDKIVKYENITDNICSEVSLFITKLIEINLSSNQGRKLKSLSRMVNELESIADQCKLVVYSFEESKARGYKPVAQNIELVRSYFETVLEFYESIFSEFAGIAYGSEDSAVEPMDVEGRGHSLKENYLEMMSTLEGSADNSELVFFCRELLISLNQVRSHTLNIYQSLVLLK